MKTRSPGGDAVAGPVIRSARAGPFDVSVSRFPPGFDLPAHQHERPIFAVFLSGAMEIRFGGHRYDCAPGSVQIHPPGERHSQRFPDCGGECLVLEPDTAWVSRFQSFERLLDRIAHYEHAGIEAAARRARGELVAPDDLTAVVLESLALDMLAGAARLRDALGARGRPPGWLARTTQHLRDSFREPLSMDALAREAGVHPAHLARAFRRFHGLTVGEFVRRLRLDWAARRLAGGEYPIAAIAVEAGFADQSHFTRGFKRYTGHTPGDYRSRAGAH